MAKFVDDGREEEKIDVKQKATPMYYIKKYIYNNEEFMTWSDKIPCVHV